MFPVRCCGAASLVLALCAASLALPVAAGAQADPARVRVAHFSPDAPNVDIYVNDDRVLSDVPYKTVSDYLELPPGPTTWRSARPGRLPHIRPGDRGHRRGRGRPTPWPPSAPWPTSPSRSTATT